MADFKLINNLTSDDIQPGQELKLIYIKGCVTSENTWFYQ